MNNTRFNPTMNGFIHAGHVCMALVNECEAQKQGGKFIVRLDDTQIYWNDHLGKEQVNTLIKNTKWLFDRILKPGFIFTKQSEYAKKQGAILKQADEEPCMYFHDHLPNHFEHFDYYPYTAKYTAEKVIMDMIDGVTLLIRGIDLITEFSLYEYYVEKYAFPKVTHWYLPRLTISVQGKTEMISKTNGNCDMNRMLAIYKSWEEVIAVLKKAYLKDPKGEWEVSNVRQKPVLDLPK